MNNFNPKNEKIRIILVILFMILLNISVDAQIIKGVVSDKSTKQPVSDVYIKINGFIYAITNDMGKFEIRSNSIINARMTLHHVAYQNVAIDAPFDNLPDTLLIEEKVNVIPEVSVSAQKKNKKLKTIKRVTIVEYIIGEGSSLSSVRLVRSSGDPWCDAIALQIKYNPQWYSKPRGMPIREKHVFFLNR